MLRCPTVVRLQKSHNAPFLLSDDNSEEGFPLELGATWIHGIHGNPVFKLAKQHKLLTPSPRRATRKRTSRGHKVRVRWLCVRQLMNRPICACQFCFLKQFKLDTCVLLEQAVLFHRF